MQEIFEWKRLLFNDLSAFFLFEVIFRSVIMFTILLLTLRVAGKRGVRQLSLFETVIIIALGSAAGDPMFYEDVGIIPALVVFIVIISMYRLVTWLTGKSKRFESFIEGKTECIIEEGKFSLRTFKKETLALDEFFAELRLRSVEHLGQVRNAFIETSGQISAFYYDDSEVKFGLPILPTLFNAKSKVIRHKGMHSCTFCGNTEELNPGSNVCKECKRDEWVSAIKTVRRA